MDWIVQRFNEARASGNLILFENETTTIESAGIHFLVRICPSIKQKMATADHNRSDPFLPFDPALYLDDLGKDHVLLLNKYCVVPHHLLVITKRKHLAETAGMCLEYEEQSRGPTRQDFWATAEAAKRIRGRWLGFYNCGPYSGASQSHRHLQLLPCEQDTPIDRFIAKAGSTPKGEPFQIEPFRGRFEHAFVRLDEHPLGDAWMQAYDVLAKELGLADSFNLVFTNEWMMLVPRKAISTQFAPNSMTFVGFILVQSQDQLDDLCKITPIAMLSTIAM